MTPTNFLLTRAKFLQAALRRPLVAELGMTLRTELQSTRDLLNFDSAHPLAGMYRDERKASLIQAGAGLLSAAASVVYPPLALATPATLYGGYKAANLFRPAAFLVGAALGVASSMYFRPPAAAAEPGLLPPTELPAAPTKPEQPSATGLALASQRLAHS